MGYLRCSSRIKTQNSGIRNDKQIWRMKIQIIQIDLDKIGKKARRMRHCHIGHGII